MSSQHKSGTSDDAGRAERAKRLRETLSDIERQKRVAQSPRAFTERGAAEAAQKNRNEPK
jgi:hypothetical protein